MFSSSSGFKKAFKRLSKKIQEQALTRLELLAADEFHPLLNIHKLHGEYTEYYSMNVTADYRIIYKKIGNVFFLILVGTHSKLYS